MRQKPLTQPLPRTCDVVGAPLRSDRRAAGPTGAYEKHWHTVEGKDGSDSAVPIAAGKVKQHCRNAPHSQNGCGAGASVRPSSTRKIGRSILWRAVVTMLYVYAQAVFDNLVIKRQKGKAKKGGTEEQRVIRLRFTVTYVVDGAKKKVTRSHGQAGLR